MITLVLPVLGRERFYRNVERMIQHQTVQPDEVLILEEKYSLQRHSDRIDVPGARYIELDGEWVVPQRKFVLGGQEAKGDVILTWSTDDYFGPKYIEQMTGECSDGTLLVSFLGCDVYNIIDRRYGYQNDINSGHHAYRRELLGMVDEVREKWLTVIHGNAEIPSVRIPDADYMTIRHAPAGEMRDGWRRSERNPMEGGHMGKHEFTNIDDEDWGLFDKIIPDKLIRDFYKGYAAHVLEACPMRPA